MIKDNSTTYNKGKKSAFTKTDQVARSYKIKQQKNNQCVKIATYLTDGNDFQRSLICNA